MAISAAQYLQGSQGPGLISGLKSGAQLRAAWDASQANKKKVKEKERARSVWENMVKQAKGESIDYDVALQPFMEKHPEVLKQMTAQNTKNGVLDKESLFSSLSGYNPEMGKEALKAADKGVNWDKVHRSFRKYVTPEEYSQYVGPEEKEDKWKSIGGKALFNPKTSEIKYLGEDEAGGGVSSAINQAIGNKLHLVNNQQEYDALKSEAGAAGLDVSRWPGVYSESAKNSLMLASIGDTEKSLKIVTAQERADLTAERNRLMELKQEATDKKTEAMIDIQLKKLDMQEKRYTKREEEREDRIEFERTKWKKALPAYLSEKLVDENQYFPKQAYDDTLDLIDIVPHALESVRKLEELINIHGLEKAPTGARAEMEGILGTLQGQLKGDALFRLGVLNGGDMEFLLKVTGDPTEIFTAYSAEDIKRKFKNIKAYAGDKFQTKMDFFGFKGVTPQMVLKKYGEVDGVEKIDEATAARRKKYGY